MVSSYLAMPSDGHLQVFHIFSNLGSKHNARMVFDPRYPNLDYSNLKRGIGAHSMEKLKKKFQTIFLRPIEVNLSFCVSVILNMQATNSLEDPELDLQCILIQPQFTGSSRNRIAWRHRVSAQSFAQ